MHCVYQELLHQPLAEITFVGSSYHWASPSVCSISNNKDVLYEIRWLLQLQLWSDSKCGNEGCASQSEGKEWYFSISVIISFYK